MVLAGKKTLNHTDVHSTGQALYKNAQTCRQPWCSYAEGARAATTDHELGIAQVQQRVLSNQIGLADQAVRIKASGMPVMNPMIRFIVVSNG